MTALKLVGCLCGNFALKCMLDMKKNVGNGLLIGPKTWDLIMEIFLDIWDNP